MTVEQLLTEIRNITARMLLSVSKKKREALAGQTKQLEQVRSILLDMESGRSKIRTPEDYL